MRTLLAQHANAPHGQKGQAGCAHGRGLLLTAAAVGSRRCRWPGADCYRRRLIAYTFRAPPTSPAVKVLLAKEQGQWKVERLTVE